MSKITRKVAKQFGSTSGVDQVGVFGSFAAGSVAYSTDPDTIQSLSQFLAGWFDAVLANNSPAIEDMNALFFVIFYQLAYLMQEGIAEWNSATTYYKGSLVNLAGQVFVSITDNNTNNALSDLTNWQLNGQAFVNLVTTSSYPIAPPLTSVFADVDAAAGTIPVVLPSAVTWPGLEIGIVNIGLLSGNAVNITSAAGLIQGEVIDSLAAGEFRRYKSNGTDWWAWTT